MKEFRSYPMAFHGKGSEYFKIQIVNAILNILTLGLYYLNDSPGWAFLILYGGIITLMPLAIHGSYKYRMAKTSWKGIRFGYSGDRGQLIGLFFKGLVLTIL